MNVANHDFPLDHYPIRIEALHPITRAVVWTAFVETPERAKKAVLLIPPLRQQLGHRVLMRLTFATGEVVEEGWPE